MASGEEVPAPESKDQLAKKLEYSASLEVQQQNRPLATLQKHMHNQRLLVDDDDELNYLREILAKVHDEYYKTLGQDSEKKADIKTLLPLMKSKVFEDCHFVFSGLIPLGTNINRADIVLWTNMFGAQSSPEIDDSTTHVITRTPGTYKARIAKAFNENIKVVHPDWVFECLVSWKHVDEKPYELIVEQTATDEELGDYKQKLARRSSALAEQEMELAMESAKNGTINLFAGGTSWLNDDDDDEMPDGLDDSDDEDDDDEQEEEKTEDQNQVVDGHTSQPKRSLENDHDSLGDSSPYKKSHVDELKQDNDSDSEIEEELLNALDE